MEIGMEFHVVGELQLNARRPKSVDIYVHGEVVGLKNGELVLGGILEGDYEDRTADRLLGSYR